MSGSKTIIVAGYSAWAKTQTNPAMLVMHGVEAREWPDHTLIALEVPVRTHGLQNLIETTLREHRPDIWLGIGVAAGAPTLRLEMVGTNWRDFDVPDAAGVCMSREPVIEGGPAAYNATIPNAQIVEAIRAAGIPAIISYSAGSHMCNQMLYTTRHLSKQHGLATLCGFLHVPLTPAHVADDEVTPEPLASMALDMMIEGACIAVAQIVSVATTGRPVS